MRPCSCPAVVQLAWLPHCANSAVPTAAGGTQTDTDRHRHRHRHTDAAGLGTAHNAKRNYGVETGRRNSADGTVR
jgi:hypothetical protein